MTGVVVEDEALVRAPAEEVWAAIADPARHARWHPFLEGIEGTHDLGAVRACAVRLGAKTGRTEERCTVRDEGRRIAWSIERDTSGFSRMVAEWSAGFALEPRGSATLVKAHSAFRPRGLLVRLMLPMVRARFHKAHGAILAGLRASVEA